MVIFSLTHIEKAKDLAQKTGLPLATKKPSSYYLTYNDDYLCVKHGEKTENFSIKIDMNQSLNELKRQKLGFRKDLLCKAVGFKGQENFVICDGTLGFAKDALHFVSFGIEVIGCEFNPVIFALQEDALQHSPSVRSQLSVLLGHTYELLPDFKNKIRCLYLDPMFEDIKKKSAPKKEMAFLRNIEQGKSDMQRVIKRAVELGVKRVVVKRPINGDHLYKKPNLIFAGKLVRYDVYIR